MNEDSSIGTLAAVLRRDIARLRPGDRLPPSRSLVAQHKVSPVTVSRALSMLAAEGLVVTRPGSGTFVADRPLSPTHSPDLDWQAVALTERAVDTSGINAMLALTPEGSVPLNGGYLHASLQPTRALATAAAKAARRPSAWERPPIQGIPELRSWFAKAAGPDIAPSDVLVTGGGQASLSITLRALLPPGSPILVESPTYTGVLVAARAAGLHPVPVPVDRDGVRPDLLAEAFAVSGARVFYCQPTFHNPTGIALSAERRAQVIAVARAAGAFLIEDDYARYLGISASPPPLLDQDRDGTVVHLTSVTKIIAPSVRISAVIARGAVAERLRSSQLVESFFPSRMLQETVMELVGSPAWPRHLAAVRAALRRRRDALSAALRSELPDFSFTPPPGGMHIWLTLPPGLDEEELVQACTHKGVVVCAGRPFYPAEPPGPRIRVGYVSAASEAELTEGVRRIAEARAPVEASSTTSAH